MTERQQKQIEIAEERKRQLAARQHHVIAPIDTQPAYPVPEADETLLAAQTASWSTHEEIKILRFHLAKVSASGGSANTICALVRAIDSMIARQQSTALRCGEYLSRQAASDFIKAIISVACEAVREHCSDQYEVIVDDMRARMAPYFYPNLPATIVAANERHEA